MFLSHLFLKRDIAPQTFEQTELLIKKHASRELLSFKVLKMPLIKKNVKHS